MKEKIKGAKKDNAHFKERHTHNNSKVLTYIRKVFSKFSGYQVIIDVTSLSYCDKF